MLHESSHIHVKRSEKNTINLLAFQHLKQKNSSGQALFSENHHVNVKTAAGNVYDYIILNNLLPADLPNIARVVQPLSLLTGGSGLGGALAAIAALPGRPENIRAYPSPRLPVILCGNCSVMTNRQVDNYKYRLQP